MKLKRINILKILERYPLFTLNNFVRISGKTKEYCRTYLYRLRKDGLIFRIEKGKYSVLNDPLIFSSYLLTPSYISFWTALRFYNLTEQLPKDIMIASSKSKDKIMFEGTKIAFFKIKHMWGYRKVTYGNCFIFIADKEKSIIDSLLLKNVSFNEIIKAIKTKEIDYRKLIEYSIKTKNKSLIKRIGYILEEEGYNARELIRYLDSNYVSLDFDREPKGKQNKKWKIIVNRSSNDIY